jgi:predicted dehydrogenase/nucleoside-diphosphate-sugar epimerase
VCLIGAGYISHVHAEALAQLRNVDLAAVVDPDLEAARQLAARWKIPNVYGSVGDALAANAFERAHVLSPPDLHCELTLPLLRAGKAAFVEKPLGVSSAECDDLIAAATPNGPIGVNQNFVYHPAFRRLLQACQSRKFGALRRVDVLYNLPLRQLEARQFSHWMFRSPRNIFLEQAVHPISQLVSLCGSLGDPQVSTSVVEEIAPGAPFVRSFDATFASGAVPAIMRFALGQTFPIWDLRAVCDDGMLVADMIGNRFWTSARTRWLTGVDVCASGLKTAAGIAGESGLGFAAFGLSMLGVGGRSDAFYKSMLASIRAFHQACDAGTPPPLDGYFGRNVIQVCERLAEQTVGAQSSGSGRLATGRKGEKAASVAVIGGTGFIGAQLVSQLVCAGHRVAVLARNVANLPAVFGSDEVDLHRGDMRDPQAIATAIAGTEAVVNLAHGGGGDSWEAIRDKMVGGAEIVARACLNVRIKLLHISSIAALYAGPQKLPITGATPTDQEPELRAPYARAKVECEAMLTKLAADEGLRLCILRPGLVVGAGCSPFHSGVGFYNNDQHCIGWNAGRNPLPFVLVEDVAAAIASALTADAAIGRCYNLVGDVRLTAREYISALAAALHRPLKFHPQSPSKLYAGDLFKWGLKSIAGRRPSLPSQRDLVSRGLKATFDCSDAKRGLHWNPVSDRLTFLDRAIAVHSRNA